MEHATELPVPTPLEETEQQEFEPGVEYDDVGPPAPIDAFEPVEIAPLDEVDPRL
jgi:hypothetical protein